MDAMKVLNFHSSSWMNMYGPDNEITATRNAVSELVAAAWQLLNDVDHEFQSERRLLDALKPFTASTEASADQSPQVAMDSLPLVNSITEDGS